MTSRDRLTFPNKWIKYSAWLTFVLLCILSVVFYKERATNLDSAYQLFGLIIHDEFFKQNMRFGTAIVHVFPLLAARLSLPFEYVLIIHSFSYVLLPFLCFWILMKWVKNESMAIVIALFVTVIVSYTFYWMQSELILSCILTLFFYGLLMKWMPLNYWLLPLFFALSYVIVFLHPMAFIPFIFLWLFILISPIFKKNIAFYTILVFAILVLVYKHLFLPTSTYDKIGYEHLEGIFQSFWNFFSFKSTRDFFRYCINHFHFLIPLFILVTVFYIRKKRKLKLALFLAFFFGYLYLINGSFREGMDLYHMESFYRVLCIFLVVPIMIDIFQDRSYKKILIYVLSFIFLFRITHITLTHKNFTKRVEWNLRLIDKIRPLEGQKFILYEEDAPPGKPYLHWSAPFETLFLTRLEHADSIRTVLITQRGNKKISNHLERKDIFFAPWGPSPKKPANFKNGYFNFRDTTAYTVLGKEDVSD